MKILNIWKHFKLITQHKFLVFKFSLKAGIPIRGLLHDLSKYGPTEFFESVKYYNGTRSPIIIARQDKGYSNAWIHHRGHNKHHEEYWYDSAAPIKAPIIPYKYAIEMICDNLSASIVYKKENFNNSCPLQYWKKYKDKNFFHPKMQEFIQNVWEQLEKEGIDKTINKKNLKEKYERYCK